jgi:microfibrillar-associated protein 1
MEMQDKSGLPAILQKRKGAFGKKGQSKYTHLTAEDTTDTNPLTRAD